MLVIIVILIKFLFIKAVWWSNEIRYSYLVLLAVSAGLVLFTVVAFDKFGCDKSDVILCDGVRSVTST